MDVDEGGTDEADVVVDRVCIVVAVDEGGTDEADGVVD